MVEHRLGVGHQDLHEPSRQRPLGLLRLDRRSPDEVMTQVDRKPQPGLEHRVGVVDVVAVVAVALLHPQARQRLETGVRHPHRLARRDKTVVDVRGLLDRDVELVPQLADVGDAHAEHPGVPDVDGAIAIVRILAGSAGIC